MGSDIQSDQRTQLEQIRRQIHGIVNLDPATLERENLNEYSFRTIAGYTRKLQKLCRDLHACDLSYLPAVTLAGLISHLSKVERALNALLNFTPNTAGEDLHKMHQEIIGQVMEAYDVAYRELVPIIAYELQGGQPGLANLEKLSLEAQRNIQAANDKLEGLSQDEQVRFKALIDSSKSEITSIMLSAKAAAREAGIVAQSAHFTTEAQNHKTEAAKWLTITTVLAAITLAASLAVVVYYLFVGSREPLPPTVLIQIGLSKVVLFSLLVSAVIWSGKIFRAHKHNEVINQHRMNALLTFRAFAESGADDQTRNAILIQATTCIFSPQPTGYITSESDSDGKPQVLEIIRGIGESKS